MRTITNNTPEIMYVCGRSIQPGDQAIFADNEAPAATPAPSVAPPPPPDPTEALRELLAMNAVDIIDLIVEYPPSDLNIMISMEEVGKGRRTVIGALNAALLDRAQGL